MSRLRRIATTAYMVFFVAALFFLGTVFGVIAVRYEVPPGPWLQRAVTALMAWNEFVFEYRMGRLDEKRRLLFTLGYWQRARSPETGVTRHDPARAFQGYTVYTSPHEHGARLVDMDGRLVHHWQRSFAEIWPNPVHLAPTPVVDPEFIMWRHVHVYPNGDIVAAIDAVTITPWGYGLAKLDRDSNVIWTYDGRVHHDLEVAADGRIATLAHRLREKPLGNLTFLRTPMVEDLIVVLSPDGKPLLEVSLQEALAESPWEAYLHLAPESETQDYLHTNTVRFVPEEFARKNPPLQAGDLMVTVRELDTVVVIRPETGKAVWARRLAGSRPHGATPLPSGNIIYFDNRGCRGPHGSSRVVEIIPWSNEAAWVYEGGPDNLFHSTVRSGQQVLPNGNVLITESDAARMLEVTRGGDIVWEFRSPHRSDDPAMRGSVAVLCTGIRYAPEQVPFVTAKP